MMYLYNYYAVQRSGVTVNMIEKKSPPPIKSSQQHIDIRKGEIK